MPQHEVHIAPFKSDGCSLFPDRSLTGNADWCHCCLAHDLAYWRGGTSEERLAADREFQSCVTKATNNAKLGELMFAGVRVGGGPELATSYRWGYGWPLGRGYKPLSKGELAEAKAMENEYLKSNRAQTCPSPAH